MNREDTRGNRRKRLIVLPGLQQRLIKQCSIWPFAVLAAAVLFIGICWRRLINEFADSGAQVTSLGWLMVAFAVLVGVTALVVLYQSVLFSNRIAGPLFRVHQVLDAVRAGDFSQRMAVRDRDLLPETADILNATLEYLERNHGAGATAAPKGSEPESARRDPIETASASL